MISEGIVSAPLNEVEDASTANAQTVRVALALRSPLREIMSVIIGGAYQTSTRIWPCVACLKHTHIPAKLIAEEYKWQANRQRLNSGLRKSAH